MHGASKIIVKHIKHQNQTEDISNISVAWSEWSVNECEIKVGIIIHLSYFCGNIRKGKKFPGAYLNLGSEYCISLPFLAPNIEVLEELRIKYQKEEEKKLYG